MQAPINNVSFNLMLKITRFVKLYLYSGSPCLKKIISAKLRLEFYVICKMDLKETNIDVIKHYYITHDMICEYVKIEI